MGTSGSSTGPGKGVPMVPPWADDPAGAPPSDSSSDDQEKDDATDVGGSNPAPQPAAPLAPSGRFGPARASIGSFSRGGGATDMRRGIGRYVSKGYGGSATAARRMGSTARVAGNLAGALSGGIPGGGAAINARLEELRGKSAKEIINGIIDVVAPVDGTQDSEASRESVCEVLSELLDQRPDTDLLNLDDDSRSLVIERFVAADVYRRIFLDIGKKIQDAAPSAAVGLQRLRQVKDYVRETVKAAFAKVKSSGGDAQASVVSIARRALRATFEVFEAYAE